MSALFSSTQMAVEWAASVLETRACTYMPDDAHEQVVCVVERTGGDVAYPHDAPEISFQIWAKAEADAEAGAMMVAIAASTKPPEDPHVNAVGAPTVFSYGREEGGWFVWQATVPFSVRLID